MKTELKKLLVILDLDETLIHSTSKKFKHREYDYCFDGDMTGYIRPGAKEFVDGLLNNDNLNVMIWTNSSQDYAENIIRILDIDVSKLKLLFTRKKTVIARIDRDSPDYGHYMSKNIKDLIKVKRKLSHPFSRMIAVDDEPKYYERQYSNLIRVPVYEGDNDEQEPFGTINKYIEFLQDKPNVRVFEKRRIFNIDINQATEFSY